MGKRVAIVVVWWNGKKYLESCLGSLARMNRGDLAVTVIVADNGSTDGSTEALRAAAERGELELLETGSNLGFTGGNNYVLRRVLEQGYDYAYLLNQDTEVQPDFLVEAVTVAEADARIAAVQSLLLLMWARNQVNSAGNAIHFLGLGYCLGYREAAAKHLGTPVRDIAYGSGAGLLLRVAALREVGLLEEEFFMYHEDLDLGWKLRLAGWRVVIAPASVVWHDFEFSRSIKKYFWMERNRFVVLFGRLSGRTLAVLAVPLLLAELGLLLPAVRGGWWREKLRVYRDLLTNHRTHRLIARLRAETCRLRRVSDREIASRFVAAVEGQEVEPAFTKYVANPLMRLAWGAVRLFI
jgi:GT2 family glycosyltransferase